MNPGAGFRTTLPRTAESWCALVLFVCLSTGLSAIGRGERSGWILMTSPIEPSHWSNTMLGYTELLGPEPIHKENIATLSLVLLFHGAPSPLDMYAVRALYALPGAWLAPFLGAFNALFVVNLAAWAAAAYIAWRLALDLFADRLAGLLAVLLVGGGIGMVAHIGDYSAHLLSFSVYYAGVLVLVRSGLSKAPQSLRTHLAVGCFLALAALQYNTGLVLTVAVLGAAIGKQRPARIAAAACVALTAQRVWTTALNFLNARLNGVPWQDFYAVENAYLQRALNGWLEAWQRGPAQAAGEVVFRASEFVTFDSPAVVILGVPAALAVARRLQMPRAMALVGLLPFAIALVWATGAGARGYLVYGMSIILYVSLAGMLAAPVRHSGWKRAFAVTAIVVVLATHYAWSTAHLWGWGFPLKAYFLGWDDAAGLLLRHPIALSLTGSEATPRLFWGSEALADSGALNAGTVRSVAGSAWYALLASAVVLAYICALAVLTARSRGAILVRVAVVAAIAIGGAAVARLPLEQPVSFPVDYGTSTVPAGMGFTYTIRVGETFRGELRRLAAPGDILVMNSRVAADGLIPHLHGTPRLWIGDSELPLHSLGLFVWQTDFAAATAALETADTLTLRIHATEPLAVGGWQRHGLPGRILDLGTAAPSPVLPAFELRLLDRRRALKLVGF